MRSCRLKYPTANWISTWCLTASLNVARTELRLLSPDPFLLATPASQSLKSQTWRCSRVLSSEPPANPDSSAFQVYAEAEHPLQNTTLGPGAITSLPRLLRQPRSAPASVLVPFVPHTEARRVLGWSLGGMTQGAVYTFSSGPPLDGVLSPHPTDSSGFSVLGSWNSQETASWRRWGLC